MAQNAVQFQKGLSLPKFLEQYGTEEACREALFKLRWPAGFSCPDCGNTTYCELKSRKVFQCHRCHHQASLTARTIFEKTELPLGSMPFLDARRPDPKSSATAESFSERATTRSRLTPNQTCNYSVSK